MYFQILNRSGEAKTDLATLSIEGLRSSLYGKFNQMDDENEDNTNLTVVLVSRLYLTDLFFRHI